MQRGDVVEAAAEAKQAIDKVLAQLSHRRGGEVLRRETGYSLSAG